MTPEPPRMPSSPGGSTGVVLLGSGLIATIVGSVFAPVRTSFAYLAAWSWFTFVCLGALILVQVFHAMKAKWPLALRRIPEATALGLVGSLLAFVPIALGLEELYVWTHPDVLEHHAQTLVAHKSSYLEPTAFVIRSVVYLASWAALATWLFALSRRQDRVRSAEEAERLQTKMRRISAGSLPWMALSATFAAFDWLMSLQPAWFSSIFGIYVFAGGFLGAIAWCQLWMVVLHGRRAFWRAPSSSHHYAIGRMLLAFVVFWAYTAFFQALLIWIVDRPVEIEWYLVRLEGGWRWVTAGVHTMFGATFVVLLSSGLKRRARALAVVSAIVVIALMLERHWQVHPASSSLPFHWVDLGPWLMMSGLAVVVTRVGLGRRTQPVNAPDFEEGMGYSS